MKQDGSMINKSVFLALAINLEGKKELLGLWMVENEGAKFWLSVLTELKNQGVEDILIACIDGLKGFSDAKIQLCIIHMVRSSLKFVNWKDYKELTKDLKMIYQTPTEEQALQALAHFEKIWDDKYPYWSILAQTLAKFQHLLCLS